MKNREISFSSMKLPDVQITIKKLYKISESECKKAIPFDFIINKFLLCNVSESVINSVISDYLQTICEMENNIRFIAFYC